MYTITKKKLKFHEPGSKRKMQEDCRIWVARIQQQTSFAQGMQLVLLSKYQLLETWKLSLKPWNQSSRVTNFDKEFFRWLLYVYLQCDPWKWKFFTLQGDWKTSMIQIEKVVETYQDVQSLTQCPCWKIEIHLDLQERNQNDRGNYTFLCEQTKRERGHNLTIKVFWVTNNCWRKKKSPVDSYKEAWRHTPDLEFLNAKTKRKFQQRALRHPWKQTLQVPPCGLTWVDAGSTQTQAATSPIAILAPPLKDPPTHEPVQQQWFKSAGCYKIGFNRLQDQDANDNSALVPIPLLIDNGQKTNPIAMTSVILTTAIHVYEKEQNRSAITAQTTHKLSKRWNVINKHNRMRSLVFWWSKLSSKSLTGNCHGKKKKLQSWKTSEATNDEVQSLQKWWGYEVALFDYNCRQI